MLSVVLPVLKNKDEERDRRIKQLSDEIKTGEATKTAEGRRAIILRVSAETITEFVGHIRKMRQGDRMFRQGVVTSIVSKFDEFLIHALRVCYQQNPGWLKNPEKKISYKELLEIESLDSLKSQIIQKEIDTLMRGSHYNQLTFLDSGLKLGIEAEFPRWRDFLEITERRNLFVHTGGTVSSQYLNNCKSWGISLDEKIKEDIRLSASNKYIQKAMDCFHELSVRIAQAVARRLFSECFEVADKELNNSADESSHARAMGIGGTAT